MNKSLKYLLMACIIALSFLNSCDTSVNDPNTDQDVREKYVAKWLCIELNGPTYEVTISIDPSNSTQILIGNFHLLGASAKAYAIATSNNITIPSQEICGNTVNGSGTLVNANKINVQYTFNDHSSTLTVNATYTK
jgi:hypothetical protein